MIYLHILRWPTDTITLPAIPREINAHRVLTGGEAVVKQTGKGIEVFVAKADRNPLDTIIKLQLDGPARSIPAIRPGRKTGRRRDARQ